ncbi:MAG: dioxygenase [Leptospiraceae bacterium]|nr:dioxygenase [Leptospiraceae bacterium]
MHSRVSFVSHGAPLDVLRSEVMQAWGSWAAQRWPQKPEAVLCISAHWVTPQPMVGTTRSQELIYDFYGFPDELYRLQYPAPAATDTAGLLKQLPSPELQAKDRGWDHGVWVPLLGMFPDASVPVLQLSLPAISADELFAFGRNLGNWLRENPGIWLLTSGGMTHNLGAIDMSERMEVPEPMREFENTIRSYLESWDMDSLIDYQSLPTARINHPTQEHFQPLIVAAGAAEALEHRNVQYPVKGFAYGSLSRTCVDFV